MGSIRVTVDTFVRAETNRMLRDIMGTAGGINAIHHLRRRSISRRSCG